LRPVLVLVALLVLAGCGGGSAPPRLADGSQPPDLPPPLSAVRNAVMTRVATVPAHTLAPTTRKACDLLAHARDPIVVRRVGVDGTSLTFAGGASLYGCDAIPDRYEDPDLPRAGGWCGGAVGRWRSERLRDPRLALCTAKDGGVTAFAWVQPGRAARWVGVRSAGREDIYETAGGLPVRVATTDRVHPEGAAIFDVAEYGRNGALLRGYEVHAAVAG
jgi:hypothetical protein